MKSFTYLIIDGVSVFFPILYSFHDRIRFNRYASSAFKSIAIVASLFIGWDIGFTYANVWSFNPDYITGVHLLNLPFEEVLFFFCIPYACLFTWFCIRRFLPNFKLILPTYIYVLLAFMLAVLGFIHYARWYTFSAMILSALTCIYFAWKNPAVLHRFIPVYAVLQVPFFIVNGLLTGSGLDAPVVIYNEKQFMGFRMGSIPVEDMAYGFVLLIWTVFLFKRSLEKA